MKKKEEKPVIEPFRYSPKVTLHPGDVIRVSGGPYYPTKDGKKTLMGHHGLFVFVEPAKDGIIARPVSRSDLPVGKVYIYIGEDKISETTGTHFAPHKIRKVRNPK